ncbi:MAG: AI-2E family transporter [Cyclobacteriaceae bacterium]|nr:MAG: AI-2E family transporter [Cyclobacteriaceae bacterium]
MEAAKHPFYHRLSLNLLSIALLIAAVYLGKDVVLPVLFSILLATLLLPVYKFLLRKKFPRPLAIILPLTISLVLVFSVIFLLSKQIVKFFDDLPTLTERVDELKLPAERWIDDQTNVTVREQEKYLDQTVKNLKSNAPKMVGATFGTLTDILTYVVLIPIYTFLVLYYKDTIKAFLMNAFRNGSEKRVEQVLNESTSVAQYYIIGLSIETAIVFALNVTGFLILGIKYAVFLALLAALLNLIPYVGILSANIICMFITLVSSDTPTDAIWVGVILAVVQFFDNNFGMPMIVGNRVKINALVTILGILIGGAVCGIPGMFLAIPALAVMKVICERVPDLRAWGILLSEEENDIKRKRVTKKAN